MRFVRIVLVLAVAALWTASCTLFRVELGPRPEPLEERTILGAGKDKVLMVSLNGVLSLESGRSSAIPWQRSESPVARLAEELEKARQDPDIKALVVRIDSPGGSVAASDLIYHQIMEFKRKKECQAVACLMGVAASGGYYAALGTDRIVAMPTTLTGSIGVIAMKLDLAGLMERVGVQTETVKSAEYKDMWTPFRPATEDERRIMQGMIDRMARRFREVLAQGRPNMTEDQVREAATARVFTAEEALALGLVDEIGYPEDAYESAGKLAGIKGARLVVYDRPGGYRSGMYAGSGGTGRISAVRDDLLEWGLAPRLMYMWVPGLAW